MERYALREALESAVPATRAGPQDSSPRDFTQRRRKRPQPIPEGAAPEPELFDREEQHQLDELA